MLANEHLDTLWENADDHGLWIRKEDLPTIAEYKRSRAREWFDGFVSEARLKQLQKGAQPTTAEIAAFQQRWVDRQFETDGDADFIPGYAIVKIQSGMLAGTALILRTGYSFSRVRTWLEGLFSSQEEAEDYMRRGGWLDT